MAIRKLLLKDLYNKTMYQYFYFDWAKEKSGNNAKPPFGTYFIILMDL